MKPVWLTVEDVAGLHDEALAEFGGAGGIRDAARLENALAKPQNLLAYGGRPNLFDLAAAYCIGIAKNHPFIDGNERTAFLTAAVFLDINGCAIDPPEAEVVEKLLQAAEGTLDRKGLAAWLESCARKIKLGPALLSILLLSATAARPLELAIKFVVAHAR
ncbi:MAG: type II toxin-antitoxin system death-on-curing family toxin [Candidatus Binataceae bacterium]